MFRKVTLALISLTMLVLVTGCNTMNGVGKDVSAGGDAISNASK
ncbi:entericidin A/B family lipoprotein [Orbaceae bacterium ac157xtp]